MIFCAHTKIPPWEEQSILRELEHNQVNCILLANIYKQEEAQFGVFGQTYCPVIARYIEANFTPVAKFGNWTDEPGSYVNHGVVILKRKQPSVEGGASQIGEVGSVPATPFALSLPGGQ